MNRQGFFVEILRKKHLSADFIYQLKYSQNNITIIYLTNLRQPK